MRRIICILFFFYVHGSVHRESMWITVQQDATIYSLLYFCKLVYMFRVVTHNCNYSIWHWPNSLCYLPLSFQLELKRKLAETVWPVSNAVITDIGAPDDGWSCHSAVVEQLELKRKVAETVWPVPDAVITVICAHDDGWSHHSAVVEQLELKRKVAETVWPVPDAVITVICAPDDG
jgi:hypothetical protein